MQCADKFWLLADGCVSILQTSKLAKDVYFSPDFSDQTGDCHWSQERFNHVISLRQRALLFARQIWADYIFVSQL